MVRALLAPLQAAVSHQIKALAELAAGTLVQAAQPRFDADGAGTTLFAPIVRRAVIARDRHQWRPSGREKPTR